MDITRLYTESLALLTDLYELTMAYGYWKLGRAEQEAAFTLTFRNNPFGGGFSLAAGLEYAVHYLRRFHFRRKDIAYLRTVTGTDGAPLFEPAFLEYLHALEFRCDVDAIPEGTVVFPNEPLIRVVGPTLQAQILESALLNMLNFQTLVATKAARICQAAEGEPVIEFGLRRAQGIDGALTAARASIIGGCTSTSNVLAGKLFHIPVKGTHAHSWVMSFPSELESFAAYAEVMPNNCIFLVDTYDTLEGVRHAVEVGKELRAAGHAMIGVRLDSGDLTYLSIEARKILDAGGFPDAAIVGSNELDEHLIESMKAQGAKVNVWGVGTKLVTAYDQPALGGVYKLTAIRDDDQWQYKIKLSAQAIKVNTPGLLQISRFTQNGLFAGDMIYDEPLGIGSQPTIVDPADPTRRKRFPATAETEDLLVPIFRRGELVYDPPPLLDIRQRAIDQQARLHPTIKRFVNPHDYPVGLEQRLHELKTRLILHARGMG
ncbi:MAG TPA: nicotinate phosphoribosyltransferase [Armatimonadota bacterium]